MKKYKIYVCLESTDIIEAESPEDAFLQLSDDLIAGGDWQWTAEEIEEGE